MTVFAIQAETRAALWRGSIGALLGKTAFPVDCRIPAEWMELLTKLG